MVTNCKALVTAASRGLGYFASESLAERGCEIVISSRSEENLKKAAEKLKRINPKVHYVTADLRSKNDVTKLVSHAIEILDEINVVILNYGNPSCEPCTLEESSWDDWVEASKLYLASTALISKLLLKMNRRKATMIILSSFTVLEPSSHLVVSDVVRSGLTRLSKILSRSYPDKFKTVVVLLGSFKTPGAIETTSKIASKMNKSFEEFWDEMVEGLSPLQRSGKFGEFKKLISWLALDSPEYLTGTTILFDGASTRAVLV